MSDRLCVPDAPAVCRQIVMTASRRHGSTGEDAEHGRGQPAAGGDRLGANGGSIASWLHASTGCTHRLAARIDWLHASTGCTHRLDGAFAVVPVEQ